ncbi:N-acetylglucosaminyl-phosphatidylinositol de-N-acetylase-like [Hibiscus syriacus]|uniref:N-acetylglucosaminyl-phosphatidylinositol de-N-acetylase-like n=1 Tax=Hibiscus syriacus TaxID=106335 RepID=UPI001921F0BA|nr:N-acetylglucosaminyl-phosphatidylinositol de-N-acetylase-like [Hibiscus syriacus]
MGWILTILSILFVWLASLWKIFFSHSTTFKLKPGSPLHKKNVLLVVAHPDDESMFFSPTINYLTSRWHSVYLLCMSIGNADGMGDNRKDELYRACVMNKVLLDQVKVLDHPDLQDGFGQVWNHDLLANIIEEEVYGHVIDVIITFDSYGVSGHCNHGDMHYGVRKFLHDSSPGNIEAWELVSINILRKYSGLFDIWMSVSINILRKYSGLFDIWMSSLDVMRHPTGLRHCLCNEHPQKSFLAMAQHFSQWAWFRKLFISFSSYTYINTLRKIE